jgi:endonuclease/exonuclease/phosphatase family metal-dependent hydrolase
MKCLTWNLEWASQNSKRLRLIRQKIDEISPDIVCYTEAILSTISDGHVIAASADYGYLDTGERRKVILWSRSIWTEIDTLGDPLMPPGRFVSGVSNDIRFVGVCIPWRDAHVKTGRKDKKLWQDHLSYCEGLQRVLERYSELEYPLCVFGDYNQRIPRVSQPKHIADALLTAMPPDFSIVTEGMTDPENKNLIDHFSISSTLNALSIEILPRFDSDGTRLSDHVGVVATLQMKGQGSAVGL